MDKLWITFFPLIQKINYWGLSEKKDVSIQENYTGENEKTCIDVLMQENNTGDVKKKNL